MTMVWPPSWPLDAIRVPLKIGKLVERSDSRARNLELAKLRNHSLLLLDQVAIS